MLTNEQIEQLSPKMGIPLAGVFFKDELPRKLEYNKSYFINLQDSTELDGSENDGTHWCFLQVNKYPSGKIEPFFFDPYGQAPSENIISFVKNNCAKYLPYSKKDIQSLMNNACGYYCLALSHFINSNPLKTGDMYEDVERFLEMFDDLNEKVDWKKNEYILKHFFQPKDPRLRREIDVLVDTDKITGQDERGGYNMMKLGVDTKFI